MKCSPGPWTWEPFLNWDGGLRAADGTYVLRNDETDTMPENKADAALIAAAPRMREMLLRLEWVTEDADSTVMGCPSCWQYKRTPTVNISMPAVGRIDGHAPGCELAALLEQLR